MEDKEYLYKVDGHTFDNQEDYRDYLSKSKKYKNAYEPWTIELDKELIELVKTKSVGELSVYFKRRKGAIRSRLKKLNITYKSIHNENELQIIGAIIKGYNPVTGEYFDEDSVWSHHKIKEDLKNWTKK